MHILFPSSGAPCATRISFDRTTCAGRLVLASWLCSAASTAYAQALSFTECAAAGITVVPDRPNVVQGCYAGGAVGDFNRDGWQDVFIPPGGFEPDKLYINNRNGTFSDQAAAWRVDGEHLGVSAAVGDFNNDGWLDLFVVSRGEVGNERPGAHKLYRNNGDGTMTDIADSAGVRFTSPTTPDGFGAAFGDYDLDGDLDLAVAGWYEGSGGNRLFRNNGDETFADVTATAILADMTPVRGFSPRFVDMDGDHWPELLWVADFRTTRYLVNNRDGTFSDRTLESGVGLERNGMGQTIGDFDNDGRLDWYVTSIMQPFGPIGQPNGNMLYMNRGAHSYDEVAEDAGVQDGGWGWGTVAADFDHDGWQDLVEVNGWYTIDWAADRAYVFRNRGDLHFDEVAPQVGIEHTGQQRGLLNFDFDNDGDQDVLLFAFQEPVRLYRNDLPPDAGAWLSVTLHTRDRPAIAPDGFGAAVRVRCGAARFLRVIDGGCNYLAQSELSAHFGLAAVPIIDELRVDWPDGTATVLRGLPANQRLEIHAPVLGDLDRDRDVDLADLSALLSALGQCDGQPAYDPAADIDGGGCVELADLLRQLGNFGAAPP